MSELDFMAKLAEILQVDREQLNEQFPLNSQNWDSLAIIATIATIDEELGVTIPTKELSECNSVGELLRLVRLNSKKA